jgi:hypothetical protein
MIQKKELDDIDSIASFRENRQQENDRQSPAIRPVGPFRSWSRLEEEPRRGDIVWPVASATGLDVAAIRS